jgi:hypothetical protein
MTKKYLLLFSCFFLVFTHCLFAQDNLYIPKDIQQAYEKGTRTRNGTPGANYWQNASDYTIKVALDPATRLVKGEETVIYSNNSPDTLKQLVIRLYPDIFKKGNNRNEVIDPEDITEGVTIQEASLDGKSLDLDSRRSTVKRSGTNMFINLSSAIMPGSKSTVKINWSYTIPKKTHIREGTYGESSFFVAYWYPQIAVYDDINGWDKINYTGTQEFYNDFNTYTVDISVPANFIVWATGVLQNPDEILAKEYADRYKASRTSDQIVNIIKQEDLRKGKITQNKGQNTWRYKAELVPDFAFATSNKYLWDASSVVVDDKTGRRTAVGAAYNPDSKDFYEVARYGRETVDFLSHQMPGIPFPYPNITVFNGSGGMEFPMMVNDGSYGLAEAAEVTAHEIAHTYFPFYMGINERKYAWMDEGWAQFLPNDMQFKLKPDSPATYSPQAYNAMAYSKFAGNQMDMPMMVPSVLLEGTSYGYASYFRPGVAYAMLRSLLGDDLFKKALQEYMRRWNGKHPMPYDFFYTFNEIAGQDLSWFWKPWFFEQAYPDLGIKNTATANQKGNLVIERKGDMPVPIHLKIIYTDNTEDIIKETAAIWKDGAREYVVVLFPAKTVKQAVLGNSQIPDANMKDNLYSAEKK